MAAVDVVVANGAAALPFALERAPAMRQLAAVNGGRALDVPLARDALPALEASDLTESDAPRRPRARVRTPCRPRLPTAHCTRMCSWAHC